MNTSITSTQVLQLLRDNKSVSVIDVRSQEEYDHKHIPFAKNIPLIEIETNQYLPDVGKIIITVCGKGGGRSEKGAQHLKKNFENEIYILEGGTNGWFETAEAN